MKKKRLIDIDFAIGISISLVVFGHLFIPELAALDGYVHIRKVIYNFHMPLFMFFSGFLLAYTYKPFTTFNSYLAFLKKKIKKFFPPYFLFAGLFIIAENILITWKWENVAVDLFETLILPPKSPAGFLWYIYVLFQFYALVPLLLKLLKGRVWMMFILSLTLHLLPAFTEFFSLNMIGYYLVFLSLGFLANHYMVQYYKLLFLIGPASLVIFILLISTKFSTELPKSILGLISIPAIHYPTYLFRTRLPRGLQTLGLNSFYIYLMNTLIIGSLAIVAFRLLNLTPSYYILFCLFISGLFFPILIQKYIVRRVPILKKLIP